MSIEIKLDDGKYTYILNDKEHKALRHGEEWRDLTGDNLILNMGFEIESLRTQLAKANERVIDSIIEPLFKARWSGDLANAPVSEMRSQLFKTLRDQTMGYWSGHTAYNIAIDGGFLINDKKGANKRLTSLGVMFVEQEQLRKEQE